MILKFRIHQELASGKSYDDLFTLKEGEEDDFDTFFDTPLMFKFIARFGSLRFITHFSFNLFNF